MNTKTNTRWLGAVTLLVTLLLLIATGWARPGGGGSYSSGRSSSSSSSSNSSSSSRSSSGGSYSSSGGSSGNFGVPLLISTMVLSMTVQAMSRLAPPQRLPADVRLQSTICATTTATFRKLCLKTLHFDSTPLRIGAAPQRMGLMA